MIINSLKARYYKASYQMTDNNEFKVRFLLLSFPTHKPLQQIQK